MENNEYNYKRNQLYKNNLVDSEAFKKRKEYLKKAHMSALGYGEEVELIKNSKSEELLEHLVGSNGIIVGRVNHAHKNVDGSVDYFVMFGDLKVDINSNDLKLIEEEDIQ